MKMIHEHRKGSRGSPERVTVPHQVMHRASRGRPMGASTPFICRIQVNLMPLDPLTVPPQVMHRASSGGLAHLAHPAVSLAMSATLGVAGGALAGALLGPPPRALRLTATVTAR